jgi:hypothetical protein
MQKQTYFNKEIKLNLKWKNTYHHPIFIQLKKKVPSILCSESYAIRFVAELDTKALVLAGWVWLRSQTLYP